MAYHYEFREKAVELAYRLNSISKASETLGIAYTTLRRWVDLWHTSDDLSHHSGGKRFEKINLTKLEEYIKQNPDKFLYEIAEEFNCSATEIAKVLKNWAIQIKKRRATKNKAKNK